MKRTAWLAVLAFAVAGLAVPPKAKAHTTAQLVAGIRAEYQAVKKALPKLKKTKADIEGESTDGGTVAAYRSAKGDLRFLTVTIYSEGWQSYAEFLFKSGRLVFAYDRHEIYNVPYTVDEEAAKEYGCEAWDRKKSKVVEKRLYLDQGRAIRLIVDGRTKTGQIVQDEVASVKGEVKKRIEQLPRK